MTERKEYIQMVTLECKVHGLKTTVPAEEAKAVMDAHKEHYECKSVSVVPVILPKCTSS